MRLLRSGRARTAAAIKTANRASHVQRSVGGGVTSKTVVARRASPPSIPLSSMSWTPGDRFSGMRTMIEVGDVAAGTESLTARPSSVNLPLASGQGWLWLAHEIVTTASLPGGPLSGVTVSMRTIAG